MKHPQGREAHPGVLSCRHRQMDIRYRSSPLGQFRLHADDLIPGSHLEVGDLEKRWMYPSGRLEGGIGADLPTRDRTSGRASVGRDKAGDLNPNRLMA